VTRDDVNNNNNNNNVKNECYTNFNSGNWDHLHVIQTIPEHLTGKARHQGATENSHMGHSTDTADRADERIKVQNI
jgi:hypothetical protein